MSSQNPDPGRIPNWLQNFADRLRGPEKREKRKLRRTAHRMEPLEERTLLAAFDLAAGALGVDLNVADKNLEITAKEVSTARPLADVTGPADTATSVGGTSPVGEEAAKAFDNQANTKFLNDAGAGSGLEISLSSGPSVVSSLRFTTANDAPERDPASFRLEGRLASGQYLLITQADVSLPAARNDASTVVNFSNTTAFSQYRLTFPTLRGSAGSVQLGELEFLGVKAEVGSDITAPGDQITAIGGSSPSGQEAAQAIDNLTANKYVNQGGAGSGFEVTPSAGQSIVTGLGFKTSDGPAANDPASYKLEGKRADGTYVTISQSNLSLPTARHDSSTYLPLANVQAFQSYRLTFPTLRDALSSTMEVTEVHLFGTVAPKVIDVTSPGDPATVVGGTSPAGNEPDKAFDNQTATKFVNDGGPGGGYEVTPAGGASVVTSLAFKTANDAPDSDPASYKLEGQLADGSYVTISEEDLNLPTARHDSSARANFANIVPYSKYRLTFPKTRGATGRVQITEIWMFGTRYTPPVTATSSGVSLKLNGDTWQGTDSADVYGNGTDTLTVTGKALQSLTAGINVADSASGASVTFADSGSQQYTVPFNVTLDDAAAGTVSFNGRTAFAGSAGLSASTAKNVFVTGHVSTVDGNLEIQANTQSTPTTGDFSGIIVAPSGIAESTGSGNVTISGRAGSGTTDSGWVGVGHFGRISGGTTGTVTVTGQGSMGTRDDLIGVRIGSGTINSLGANVVVTGIGGEGDGLGNDGVELFRRPGASNRAEITAGGMGSVTVTGTGGPGAGNSHRGVDLQFGTITSSGGNVVVTGTGAGAGMSEGGAGVRVGASTITAGGSGSVTVDGTGAMSTRVGNHGIYVATGGSVTSSNGNVTLRGQTPSESSYGVVVEGGAVTHTGTTTVSNTEISTDSIFLRDAIDVGSGSLVISHLKKNADIILGHSFQGLRPRGSLILSSPDLNNIVAGTIVIGDGTAREVSLAGNVNRSVRTNIVIGGRSTSYTSNSYSIDTMGGNLLLPRNAEPNFAIASNTTQQTVNGQTTSQTENVLRIDLNKKDSHVEIQHDGTNYVLSISGDRWDGVSSEFVQAEINSGVSRLIIPPKGQAHLSRIEISDSARNSRVTFKDSGTHKFEDDFVVSLTEYSQHPVAFVGKTTFAGQARLSVQTRGKVEVHGDLTSEHGGITLASTGDFAQGTPIYVAGTITATKSAPIRLESQEDNTAVFMRGAKIVGGVASGPNGDSSVTIIANRGLVHVESSTIETRGADLRIDAQGFYTDNSVLRSQGAGGIRIRDQHGGSRTFTSSIETEDGAIELAGTVGETASIKSTGTGYIHLTDARFVRDVEAANGAVLLTGADIDVRGAVSSNGVNGGVLVVANTLGYFSSGSISALKGPVQFRGIGNADMLVDEPTLRGITTSDLRIGHLEGGKVEIQGAVALSRKTDVQLYSGKEITGTIDTAGGQLVVNDKGMVAGNQVEKVGLAFRSGGVFEQDATDSPVQLHAFSAPQKTNNFLGNLKSVGNVQDLWRITSQNSAYFTLNSGFEFTLPPGRVDSIQFSDNGFGLRPGRYRLEGKAAGSQFVTIGEGDFQGTNNTQGTPNTYSADFRQSVAYQTYRLTFLSFQPSDSRSTLSVQELKVVSTELKPLLQFPSGVEFSGDILKTTGSVDISVDSKSRRLFLGIKDSDPRQPISIDLNTLKTTGFTVDSDVAFLSKSINSASFKPTRVKVVSSKSSPHLALNGTLAWDVLNGAGVALVGDDVVIANGVDLKGSISNGLLQVVPPGTGATGTPTPISFSFQGVDFQVMGNNQLTARFDKSTNVFRLFGKATSIFDGGVVEVDLDGKLFITKDGKLQADAGAAGFKILRMEAGGLRFEPTHFKMTNGMHGGDQFLNIDLIDSSTPTTTKGTSGTDSSVTIIASAARGILSDQGLSFFLQFSELKTSGHVLKGPANSKFRASFYASRTDVLNGISTTYSGFVVARTGIDLRLNGTHSDRQLTAIGGTDEFPIINGELRHLKFELTSVSIRLGKTSARFTQVNDTGIRVPVAELDPATGAIHVTGGQAESELYVDRTPNRERAFEARVNFKHPGSGIVIGKTLAESSARYRITNLRADGQHIDLDNAIATFNHQTDRIEVNRATGAFRVRNSVVSSTVELVPNPDDPSLVKGLVVTDQRGFNGLGPLKVHGLALVPMNDGKKQKLQVVAGLDGSASSASVVIDGTTSNVVPKNLFLNFYGFKAAPEFTVPGSFSMSGFTLENPTSVLRITNPSSKSPTYSLALGEMDFQIGDVVGKTTAGIKLDVDASGNLTTTDDSTFSFKKISVYDIDFADDALTATYNRADRRFTFKGDGRYLGLADVSIPRDGQLIEERGVFKLVGFKPPRPVLRVAGLVIPTENLTETTSGNVVTYKGSITLFVGGAKVVVTLGGAGTAGLQFNTATRSVVAMGGTISGAFTIGNVKVNLTGAINYDASSSEKILKLSGTGDFTLQTPNGPATLQISLNRMIIVDGQFKEFSASVSAGFSALGLDISVDNLTIEYVRDKQEFKLYGVVGISTAPVAGTRVLDNVQVTVTKPGFVIRKGVLEEFNIRVDGSINLRGVTGTADGLTLKYRRSTGILALTGGVTVTVANRFTGKAAFPGAGLLINTRTGEVQLRGLHISVGEITLGAFTIDDVSFTYLDDGKGNTTFEGSGQITIQKLGLTIEASILLKNGKLSGVSFKVERSPGIPLGHPPVIYLNSVEGSLENLDDIDNVRLVASVTATVGPSINMFGQTRALVEVKGTIDVNKERVKLIGEIELLEGIFGTGRGEITVFLGANAKERLRVEASVRLYPGGVFRGTLNFTMDSNFKMSLKAWMSVNIPDFIPRVGGRSLGSAIVTMSLDPKASQSKNHVAFFTEIFKISARAIFYFDGKVFVKIDPPVFKAKSFTFYFPGTREGFVVPIVDSDAAEVVPPPTIALDNVVANAGTPGATITYTATSEFPTATTVDLYVDTEAEGYGGTLIAENVPFQAGQATFNWKDLAAYGSIPYDANRPVYVYAAIDDGEFEEVFSAYSGPITPPDYTPSITLPSNVDYGVNQELVFSNLIGNVISIDDPLAIDVADTEIRVELSAKHGDLTLVPQNARPWQNLNSPFDANQDGHTSADDAMRLVELIEDPTVLYAGGFLPQRRSSTSDLPYYDITGDGIGNIKDALSVVSHLNGHSVNANENPTTKLTEGAVQIEGDGSGRISLTGKMKDVNALIDGLTYSPYDNNFQEDEVTVSVKRFPAFYVEPVRASFSIKPRSLTLGNSDGSTVLPLIYEQGSGHQQVLNKVRIHAAVGGHITGATVQIDMYEKGKDLLDLDLEDQRDLGLRAQFDADSGTLRLSGVASVEAYERALHLIKFCTSGNSNRILVITVGDSAGAHAELEELIYVVPINQPPEVITGGGQIFEIGAGPVAVLPTIDVTDPEGEDLVWARIAFDPATYIQSEDTLEFFGQPGVNGTFDAATGVLTLTGPADDILMRTALQTVEYDNTAGTPTTGIRDLTITVSDGKDVNAETTVRERLIVVAPGTSISVPEVDNLPTALVTAPKDATPIVLAPDLTITGTNAFVPNMMHAVVRINAGFTAGADFLNAKGLPAGISKEYDPFNGVLFLSGSASAEDYEYALRQVTYSNQETVRNGAQREIEFEIFDGFTSSLNIPSMIVDPPAMPVVEAGVDTLVYSEGRKSVPLNPNVGVRYNALPVLTGGSITFSFGYQQAEDRLEFTDQNGITGSFDASTGVLTLTGTTTVEDYQAAFRSVQYHNLRMNPTPGAREVLFQVHDDLNASDPQEMMAVQQIRMASMWVPPTTTLDSDGVTFTENSAAIPVAASLTITDQDTLPPGATESPIRFTEATVRISGYVKGEDVLAFTETAGFTGEFDADNGTLFLMGTHNIATWQQLLRTVTYENVSEAPTTDPRQLKFVLASGANNAVVPPITVDVVSLNNGPTRTGSTPADLTVLENAMATSLGLDGVSYDPPSSKTPTLVYTVQLVPESTLGEIRLADDSVVTVGQELTLTQLQSVSFLPALNADGSGQFEFSVAGLNPILNQADPAHLTETVNITVVGVQTDNSSDAFEAQAYRDLLGRNATAAELAAASDDLATDAAVRRQFVDNLLASRDYRDVRTGQMIQQYLQRAATQSEIDALFAPDFALNDDFSGAAFAIGLESTDAGSVTVANGAASFAGANHNYLRTTRSDYNASDFMAEVTVTVGGDQTATAEEQVVFFGMGSGNPDATNGGQPSTDSSIFLRIGPDGFNVNGSDLVDIQDNGTGIGSTSAVGGTGTHRLRMLWDATAGTMTFEIDQDYAGGAFTVDHSFTAVDGSDNGFDATNSRVFFGSAGNTQFDDFMISGAPLTTDLDEVRSTILGSDEYYQNRGNNGDEGFVQALFTDLIGRAPSQTELDQHVQTLTSGGSRTQLATSLATGNEGAAAEAGHLVRTYLRRDGELFQLVELAKEIQTSNITTVLASLVASDEYLTRYGTQTSADSRSIDEIEAELIEQWLFGAPTQGNAVETDDFTSVGTIGDGYTGRGGATLIAPQYVLTAAHLVDGWASQQLFFTIDGVVYGVTDVHVHQGYNNSLVGTDQGHDIAVLRLNREVVGVQPSPIYRGQLNVGQSLTLVGYGAHPGDDSFGTKRTGTTPIDGVTPNLITWTYDGAHETTTVPGDSGSPQFVQTGTGEFAVASVASGGTHQALSVGDFAYNTRVDAYVEWIAAIVGGSSIVGPVPTGLENAETAGGNRPYGNFGGVRNGATHNVQLVGDDLLIRDLTPSGVEDDLTISTTATHVLISDSGRLLTVDVPNATGDGTQSVSVPLAEFTGNIIVSTAGGDDSVKVITPSRLVQVDGGTGSNSLIVDGADNSDAEEFNILDGGGTLILGMNAATTTGPYTVEGTGITSLRLNALGGNDTVTVEDLSGLSTALPGVTIDLGDGDDLLSAETTSTPVTAFGGDGLDRLNGGNAGDTFHGGDGDDELNGGPGDDRYVFDVDGQLGFDTVNEDPAAGTDTIDFSPTSTLSVAIDLRQDLQQEVDLHSHLTLTLSDNIENVTGGAAGNVIIGDAQDNVIMGGAGVDILFGAGGSDTISGKEGHDRIVADAPGSELDGNLGSDLIEYRAGNITFPTSVPAAFQISGSAAQGEFDRIQVTGDNRTVTLGGATIDVMLDNFVPAANEEFTIVDLTETSSTIAGTFSFGGQSLAEGATFLSSGENYQISYQGGDGNDVTLTFLPSFTVTESDDATQVDESGTTDTFDVVLNRAPASDVVLTVASGDTGEATVPSATLTFTPANWNVAQTVTVTGVSDDTVDGSQTSTITISVDDAASDDSFDPLSDRTLTVTTADIDVPGFTITESAGATAVDETGTMDTFGVVLDKAPLTDVVLTVVSGNTAEATVSPATLTFTSGNWNVAQTVSVTGVSDSTIDADQTTTITVAVDDAASDDLFDNVADKSLSVTTVNVDFPDAAIFISESDQATQVDEFGTTDTIEVVLSRPVTSDVVVNVTSADAGEVTVDAPTLTFTPNNWNTPQTITLTGVADQAIDGDQTTNITISVDDAASDDLFDPLDDLTVSVTTADSDQPGIFVLASDGSTQVSESGTTDTLDVTLAAAPATDVVLNVSSGDTGEVSVSPATLTFTPANWNVAQPVTITGVADTVADGNQTTDITFVVDSAASDDAFDSLPDHTVPAVAIDNDAAGFTVTVTDSETRVDESESTDTFDVVLNVAPTSDVVFSVSSGDTGEATVSPATLTFTPTNWSVAQSVTVTGVSDALVDGDQTVTVTVSVDDDASDDVFDSLGDQTVSVTVDDVDTAGFTLAESSGSTQVDESGTTDTFGVILDAAPVSDVVLTIVSGDTGEATVAPATLTFTPTNWDVAQTVTVTGVSDGIVDGDQSVTVTVSVDDGASNDLFDSLADQTLSVTNADEAVAGFTITESSGSTQVDETGTTDTFDVVLSAVPASDVVLNVSSGDTGEATVAPASLTFTPANWNVAQTVTITGVSDTEADGDQMTAITVSVDDAASDDTFDTLPDQTVAVTTGDADVAGFTITESAGSTEVVESGTTDTFDVVLDAAPVSDVVLNITSADTGEATVAPASLTFTPANWNVAQTVTVTGVSDTEADGDQSTDITVSVDAGASDDAFDALQDQNVVVVTTDSTNLAVVTGPLGPIENIRPTLTWTAVPDAESYDVWLELLGGENNPVANPTITGMSYTVTTDLGIGRYRTWVRANLPGGEQTRWTNADFQVDIAGVVQPLPFHGQDRTPAIGWDPVLGATSYRVFISNATTRETVLDQIVTETMVTPDPALNFGKHRIWVRAIGAGNFHAKWSTAVEYNLGPVPVAPVTSSFETRPRFVWTSVPGIATYELHVRRGNTIVISETGLTGTSFTPPSDLELGSYRWWMRPFSAAGTAGVWSPAGEFSVGGRPQISEPTGTITDSTPAVTWDRVDGAGSYEIYLYNDDTGEIVHRQTGLTATSFSFTPLADANYRVWVKSYDTAGNDGLWSRPQSFVVNAATATVTSTPQSPITPTFDTTPEFTWSAAAGAVSYELYLSNGESVVTESGISGTSWTPASPLTAESWDWWVRPVTSSGPGPWTKATTDTSGRAVLLSPSGLTGSQTPLFSWLPVLGATGYTLHVDNRTTGDSGVIREDNLTATSFTPASALPAGEYRIWVQAIGADNARGPWSFYLDFTVAEVQQTDERSTDEDPVLVVLHTIRSEFDEASENVNLEKSQTSWPPNGSRATSSPSSSDPSESDTKSGQQKTHKDDSGTNNIDQLMSEFTEFAIADSL